MLSNLALCNARTYNQFVYLKIILRPKKNRLETIVGLGLNHEEQSIDETQLYIFLFGNLDLIYINLNANYYSRHERKPGGSKRTDFSFFKSCTVRAQF